MLIRFKDLITLDMVATDGSRHRVEDVFVTEEDTRIAHVAVHAGGWLSGGSAVIPIGRFGEPEIADTVWPCDIDEGALREIVGEGMSPAPDLPEDEALHSVTAWIDRARVHCTDEEAGSLMDVIFEPKGWRLHYLVVGTGGNGLPRHQRIAEASRVERIDVISGRVELGLTREELHKAPDLHEIDGVEGKWYNKVLAYYGISGS